LMTTGQLSRFVQYSLLPTDQTLLSKQKPKAHLGQAHRCICTTVMTSPEYLSHLAFWQLVPTPSQSHAEAPGWFHGEPGTGPTCPGRCLDGPTSRAPADRIAHRRFCKLRRVPPQRQTWEAVTLGLSRTDDARTKSTRHRQAHCLGARPSSRCDGHIAACCGHPIGGQCPG
jgi:hypothetical protein